MQDLEELKKVALAATPRGQHIYDNPRDHNNWKANKDFIAYCHSDKVVELIDRLQAAEKRHNESREIIYNLIGVRAQCDAYAAELKALREQKPAIQVGKNGKVQFNPEYKGSLYGEFYADPVAQSRDSAEPVADEYTLECLSLAQGARDFYAKENQALREQIAATVEAKQSEPAYKDSDGYVIGENYEYGLWSRRNIEAFIADGNSAEAKQAVPDKWEITLRSLLDTIYLWCPSLLTKGPYHVDVRKLCAEVEAMLAAAPQPEGAIATTERLGTNEYGLDMGYMAGKLNLFLRDISRHTRDEAARVLARLAKVADEKVFSEPEFSQPEGAAPEHGHCCPSCGRGYGNVDDEVARLNVLIYGLKQQLEQSPAPKVQPNNDIAESMEIVKAVAHIGVDFGFGEYVLEQSTIDKARELIAIAEGGK